MDFSVVDQQIARGAPADLEVFWTDQAGDDTAASGAVTVHVQRGDGTDVVPAGSSTTGSGPYTRALATADTAHLDLLTATWTASGDGATRTTRVEIAGGFYFNVADVRAFDKSLQAAGKYPDEQIRAVRREVEEECEEYCGRAFVPRYRRVVVDGTGTLDLDLPDSAIRTIRSVTIAGGPIWSPSVINVLAANDAGRVRAPVPWPEGVGNITVEYEHGLDRPPARLRHATMTRLRWLLNTERTIDTGNLTRVVLSDGSSLDVPADADIDQQSVFRVYRAYSLRTRRAASAQIHYDPQRGSLFHGGRL